jgi:adenine-specific DNA-methyltransferase
VQEQGIQMSDADYDSARGALVEPGKLAKGRGKGGAVRRIEVGEFSLSAQEKPEGADEVQQPKAKEQNQPTGERNQPNEVISYRYDDKRTNNTHVGMVCSGRGSDPVYL